MWVTVAGNALGAPLLWHVLPKVTQQPPATVLPNSELDESLLITSVYTAVLDCEMQ